MRKNEEKVAVYIDANNLNGYLKDEEIGIGKGTRFNYSSFVDSLVGERKLVSKRYYAGITKNFDNSEKGAAMVEGQRNFLKGLTSEGFVIKQGRVIKDGGGYREKGTDVRIGVDMVVGAVEDIYDTAILVSSDTDLIPAVQYVKYKSKRLEYIGFAHAPSLYNAKICRFFFSHNLSNCTQSHCQDIIRSLTFQKRVRRSQCDLRHTRRLQLVEHLPSGVRLAYDIVFVIVVRIAGWRSSTSRGSNWAH